MAKPWDDTLKKLIRLDPVAFVRFLLPGGEFVVERPYVLEQEEIEMDGLLEVVVNEQPMLLHIEFQTYHDSTMPERLLRYNVLGTIKHRLPILSCVIYLLKDGTVPQSPLVWHIPIGQKILEFHYVSVELSNLLMGDILDIQQVGLLPLLTLTKDGANRQGVKRMFQEIEQSVEVDNERKEQLELLGYTLAALIFKKKSEADQDWLIRSFQQMHDVLHDSPIYQLILEEGEEQGIEKGIEKGRLEAVSDMLLSFTKARFPKLLPLAKECVTQIKQRKVLEDLTYKVGLAQNFEEALNYLLNWEDIYKEQLSEQS